MLKKSLRLVVFDLSYSKFSTVSPKPVAKVKIPSENLKYLIIIIIIIQFISKNLNTPIQYALGVYNCKKCIRVYSHTHPHTHLYMH